MTGDHDEPLDEPLEELLDEPPGEEVDPDAAPRGPNRTLILVVVLLLVVVGTVMVVAVNVGDDTTQPAPGDLAGLMSGAGDLTDIAQPPPTLPDTTLEALADAPAVRLADLLDGRPLVLNFWATWCAPCVAEMPDLQLLHEAAGDDVHVVGVDTQDSPLNAEPFVEELGITYTLARDPGGELFTELNGFGMPTTLFVAADGAIRYRQTGPMTYEQMLSLVTEHLGIEI